MSERCIFCEVVAGHLHAACVAETARAFAFLTLGPIRDGHTLVVPKRHVVELGDARASELAAVFELAVAVARQQRHCLGSTGENLLLASGLDAEQSVFHLHLHVLPRHHDDGVDMNSWWQRNVLRPEPGPEVLDRMAARLRSGLPKDLLPVESIAASGATPASVRREEARHGAAGFAGETAYSGITGDFLDKVSRKLTPGTWAVCADVDEDWTMPIDDAASAVGGMVFRQPVGDAIRAEMKAEDDAAREELAQMDAEIERAKGETRAKLEAKREALKAAHERRAEKCRARAEEIKKSWDAKLAAVQDKARRAKDAAKARHEEHARKLEKFVAQQKESYRELFA